MENINIEMYQINFAFWNIVRSLSPIFSSELPQTCLERRILLPPAQQRALLRTLRSPGDSSAATEPEAACCCSAQRQIRQSVKMLRITIRADVGALWALFCITYSQFLTVSSDDIVVACGGFVKSDVEINYSLIEVRVQTSRLAS